MEKQAISALNEGIKHLQQQQQENLQLISQLHTQIAALRYLAFALAKTHPQPDNLCDVYMQLMDYAADRMPQEMQVLFREDMNAVLRELLTLRQTDSKHKKPDA